MVRFKKLDGEALVDRINIKVDRLEGRLAINADMSKVAWLRAGGTAEIFFQPQNEADLILFLEMLPLDIDLTIVGIGSNLLIRDGGIPGAVIRLLPKGFGMIRQVSSTQLEVGAGATDKMLAAAALEAGIGGLHFYNGIPGGVGGALRMNAGANGHETKDHVVEVRAIDRHGHTHRLTNKDMQYAYRQSEGGKGLLFLSAIFEGFPANKDEIKAEMDAVIRHREAAQPIREKTGGSTFRNPEGHSAWRLIDEAGCRGLRVGGAQMSEMHCNFMINTADATSYDLESLGETVRKRVFEHCGIILNWEIKRLGQFSEGQVVTPFVAPV